MTHIFPLDTAVCIDHASMVNSQDTTSIKRRISDLEYQILILADEIYRLENNWIIRISSRLSKYFIK